MVFVVIEIVYTLYIRCQLYYLRISQNIYKNTPASVARVIVGVYHNGYF